MSYESAAPLRADGCSAWFRHRGSTATHLFARLVGKGKRTKTERFAFYEREHQRRLAADRGSNH